MSDPIRARRPATFKLDDPGVTVLEIDAEPSRLPRDGVHIMPEHDPAALPVPLDPDLLPARRGFRWGWLFWGSLGALTLLGAALGVTHLVEDLFARSQGLGYLGSALAAAVTLALAVIIGREALGLARLAKIEHLHARAAAALVSDDRTDSRAIVAELVGLARENPHLAHARAALTVHSGEIIDGADLIRLAERELMSPLDREARRLVSVAAQRVSIVTAISPRALIDVLFVLAAAFRLVRQLAILYGGRPGALGMIALMRQTLAHLAITGSLAASDSLIQQVVGHGIAAKLSTRLGEGIVNGLLTARLGLAAIDVTRPLPFAALPRPAVSDLALELVRKSEVNSSE